MNFAQMFNTEKTRIGLPHAEDTLSGSDKILKRDRQTDGQNCYYYNTACQLC